MYELGYELNNRPDWVHVPLGGVLRMLRRRAAAQASTLPTNA
jgi:maltose alpha-D-glucosyltransferase/alpha-amylase